MKINMPSLGTLDESHFERLLQITLPHGGYVVALIEAYFDENGTGDDSDFLCIAGYLFEKNKAVELDIHWREMLRKYGLSHFHMTDCNTRSKGYSHLTNKQCDDAAREAITLIKTYALRGIAISLEKSSFNLIPPNPGIWDRNPYAFISCQVGYGVKECTKEEDRVAYIFEVGAPGQKGALLAMDMLFAEPEVKNDFRHVSHTFMSKPDATLLQCADILVWQWLKRNRQIATGHHKVRGDFKSLLTVPTDTHHYDKKSIEQLLVVLSLM